MSVVLIKTDALSVFHPNTSQHAGTLKLATTYDKDAQGKWRPPKIEWTWKGSAHGPLNGRAHWKTDNGAYFWLETNILARVFALTNSRWNHVEEYRPWFQHSDTIKLLDWNFGKKERSDPFSWQCKVVTSPG